ncbi:MAG: hypothetical protein ACOYL6_14390 [Bacteriovoracaceae bacterium]
MKYLLIGLLSLTTTSVFAKNEEYLFRAHKWAHEYLDQVVTKFSEKPQIGQITDFCLNAFEHVPKTYVDYVYEQSGIHEWKVVGQKEKTYNAAVNYATLSIELGNTVSTRDFFGKKVEIFQSSSLIQFNAGDIDYCVERLAAALK